MGEGRTVRGCRCTLGAATTAILCLIVAIANAQQSNSVEPNLQTNTSAKTKEEAQAEFYRELTRKLNEPVASPTPTSSKSFKQGLSENPAILLTLMGALAAALVAFVSFVFNHRTTLRSQTDTQFYEALKRFGDKDSPSIRSSAAGLLGQMGQKRVGLRRKRQYLRTALDQLVTGLLLEENPAVLISIGDSLRQLVVYDPGWAAKKLYKVNLTLQEELLRALSTYFFVNGVEPTEQLVEALDVLAEAVWTRAESITMHKKYIIFELIKQNLSRFAAQLEDCVVMRSEIADTVKRTGHGTLSGAGNRLRINIETWALAFLSDRRGEPLRMRALIPHTLEFLFFLIRTKGLTKAAKIFDGSQEFQSALKNFNDMRQRRRRKSTVEIFQQFYTIYDGAFLPEAQLRHVSLKFLDLNNANLQKADLSKARLDTVALTEANLQGADFSFAEFSRVNLKGARLEGAIFGNATISQVNLYGAKIDEATDFSDFEWWKASFVGKEKGDLDTDLVRSLYDKFGSSVPNDLSAVHETTREYIATLKTQKSDNGVQIS